jgi:hypothetical protein
MKKYLILLTSMFLILSCDVELEQSPDFAPTSASLNDAEAIIFSAYHQHKIAANHEFWLGEMRSDNGNSGTEAVYSAFDIFDANLLAETSSEILQPYWDACYKAIINCNVAIDKTEDIQLIGEAKFLRALAYFKLVQAFGDVVINTSYDVSFSDIGLYQRSAIADVYNLIKTDLTSAISNLPSTNSNGRPSIYAAKALLGKVHVVLKEYNTAAPLLNDVIQNSGASLLDNYADVFATDNNLNAEIIFAIQFDISVGKPDNGAGDFTNWLSGGDAKVPTPVTASLLAAYETGDLRKNSTILNDEGVMKFGISNPTSNDWIELRLADVILLYAEALNETDVAATNVLPLLDELRLRANLIILNPNIINSKVLVREAIKKERRVELAYEGDRWFDLVRWGDAVSIMNGANSNYILFPIPENEVEASGGVITQNTGY